MASPEKPAEGGGPSGAAPPRPTRKCPICGKPVVPAYVPFCSKRCADVDLHRWLSGAYAIPGTENGPEVDEDDRGTDDTES